MSSLLFLLFVSTALCVQPKVKCDTDFMAIFSTTSEKYTLECGNCHLHPDYYFCEQEAQPVKSLCCTSPGADQWTCNNVPDGVERIAVDPPSRWTARHMIIFVNDQLKEEAHRNYQECVENSILVSAMVSLDWPFVLVIITVVCLFCLIIDWMVKSSQLSP